MSDQRARLMSLARSLGVIHRSQGVQADEDRLYSEIDVDGERRSGMTHGEYMALVERHRAAATALGEDAARAQWPAFGAWLDGMRQLARDREP